jgi:outer membrane immunogenic protein
LTFDWGGSDKKSNIVATPVGNLQATVNGASSLLTLAGRLGYAADRWLFYGRLGVAWVKSKGDITNLTTNVVAKGDHTGTGWVGGLGVEYALTNEWTAKLEYDYASSGDWTSLNTFIANGSTSYKAHVDTLVVGINYKF